MFCIFISFLTALSPDENNPLSEDPFRENVTNPQVLDSIIISIMETAHIPGLSAALIRNEQVLYSRSFGFADLDDQAEVDELTAFLLASVSKTVTGVALIRLAESGTPALDDDINQYLPFQVVNPFYPESVITIRQLAAHTSGIRDNWNLMPYCDGDCNMGLGEYLEAYLVPGGEYYSSWSNFLNQEPGTYWEYSNIGVALMGYIVETVSGMPFDEYCRQYIFQPLSMDNTSWHLSGIDPENLAMPYVWNYYSQSYEAVGHYGFPDYPDGQLRSGTAAMGHFLSMIMSGGRYDDIQIISTQSADELLTIQYPEISSDQGFVWYREERNGREMWGHEGGEEGISSSMFFNREDSMGVIILCNSGDEFVTLLNIEDILYSYGEDISDVVEGDVNSDGELNVLDIIITIQFITGILFPDDEQLTVADMNADGELNVLDIVLMVNNILGLT